MKTIKQARTQQAQEKMASVCDSVSFPPKLYRMPERIAKQKKVSLAWVVREAAEQYVTQKWALFKGQE